MKLRLTIEARERKKSFIYTFICGETMPAKNKRLTSCLNGANPPNNASFYCMFNSHVITRLKQIIVLHFETDISGLVTRELTSGTLTQVCRNSMVFMDRLLSDSRLQKTRIPTCMTLT